MATDVERIVHRLVAGTPWFPLAHDDVDGKAVRDSIVHVQAEGTVITATVTTYDGTKREYRAEFVPIDESFELNPSSHESAPGGAGTPAEGDQNTTSHHNRQES